MMGNIGLKNSKPRGFLLNLGLNRFRSRFGGNCLFRNLRLEIYEITFKYTFNAFAFPPHFYFFAAVRCPRIGPIAIWRSRGAH